MIVGAEWVRPNQEHKKCPFCFQEYLLRIDRPGHPKIWVHDCEAQYLPKQTVDITLYDACFDRQYMTPTIRNFNYGLDD